MSRLEEIEGHQRVAALLLSLERGAREALLARMPLDVVQRVAGSMLELDPRLERTGVVEKLKDALARDLHRTRAPHSCRDEELAELLAKSLGDQRGADVFRAIVARRREVRPFLAIERRDPFDVGLVLRGESAAVAALVLSFVHPDVSAKVLRIFDEEQAIEVVRRMASFVQPAPEVVDAVAASLESKLERRPERGGTSDPTVRLKRIAHLLNHSRPDLERGVIESIAEVDAEMAQELREHMFTWEDVATISPRTMQKILGTVDTKTLSVALKGCSAEVEKNVLGNLSQRVREMVREERELAGPLPATEVVHARSDILRNIRVMIETGEFKPVKGDDELVA